MDRLTFRIRVWRNSHLMGPRWLFPLVVRNRQYDEALALLEPRPGAPGSSRPPSFATRLRRGLRPWFWPRIDDAEPWASASSTTQYDPAAYLIARPGRLLTHLLATCSPADSVLDLGCNSGANLSFLYEAGFRELYGVDAGREALQLFRTTFPEVFDSADVRHDLFQRYLLSRPDDFVDVIHSNGATLELVHPSFPIVSEMCRTARRAVFVDIQERGHAYPRMYIKEFQRNGFQLRYCDRPLDLRNGSSILHFERAQ